MSIFKACDIRGLAGKELTPELFIRIGRGLAMMMGAERDIVIGGDLRPSTAELKGGLSRGLVHNGRHVIDLGMAPTPVVYFAKRRLRAYACAIVTASHNPADYNGLKFMVGDLPVLPDDMARMREAVESPQSFRTPPAAGTVSACPDLLQAYETEVLQTAEALSTVFGDAHRKLRVVADAGNGSYSEIAPRVLRGIPDAEVIPLFCAPDGRFPNRSPNCAAPENLLALRSRVREAGADLGVAFDGDGDRVAFVDDRGEFVTPDEMMVLFMRAMAGHLRGARIVCDLKCSQVVAREAQRLGAEPVMERSGHAFIKRRMITEDAAFGGEVSGHYFYRELHGGDDGLFSAILGVRLLQRSGGSLAELRLGVPARFVTPDLRISYPAEKVRQLLEKTRSAFPAERITELDGVRVSFPRGWALIRASITEPKITLRFEGEDAASLEEVIAAFVAALPELRAVVRAKMTERSAR